MTVQALGVDRVHGYPRVVVEPLLWLVVTTGVVWTAVAFDVHSAVAGGVALQPRLGVISAAMAVVLLVNGVAALLFASSPGSVSRSLAMLAGLGLIISGWAINRIDQIEFATRHKLMWGFMLAGIALTLLASVKWRVVPPPPGQERGWPVFAAMIAANARPAGRVAEQGGPRDLEILRQYLASPVRMALFDMPWVPLFLAAVFVFHPLMGVLALAGGVVLVATTLLNQRSTRQAVLGAAGTTRAADLLAEQFREEADLVQSLGMAGASHARWQRLRDQATRLSLLAGDRAGVAVAVAMAVSPLIAT